MIEPAKDRYRRDTADLLRLAKIRTIFVQEEMGPHLIVVRSGCLQDMAQVRFAEHDEMVERFATNRSDEPLDMAVLLRRAWRRGAISDPHCANAASIGWTISSVAVTNQ